MVGWHTTWWGVTPHGGMSHHMVGCHTTDMMGWHTTDMVGWHTTWWGGTPHGGVAHHGHGGVAHHMVGWHTTDMVGWHTTDMVGWHTTDMVGWHTTDMVGSHMAYLVSASFLPNDTSLCLFAKISDIAATTLPSCFTVISKCSKSAFRRYSIAAWSLGGGWE